MKRMKKAKGGFTLIELIVTIAILALVAVAVTGFMSTGARSYSTVSYALRLQMKSQLAMDQIKEQTLDCNGGIRWDSGEQALYIINIAKDGTIGQRIFRYDSADGCLYYTEGAASLTAADAQDLAAEDVTGMKVSFTTDKAETRARAVQIELSFQQGSKNYQGIQTIALRNEPLTAATAEALLSAVNAAK